MSDSLISIARHKPRKDLPYTGVYANSRSIWGATHSIKRTLSISFSCFTNLRTSSKVTAVFDAIILPLIFFPLNHNFMPIALSSIRVHLL
jgi:hypothetical protein